MADTTRTDDPNNPTSSLGEEPERDRTEGTTGREPRRDDQAIEDPDDIDEEEEDVDPDRRDNREGNM
jgi:hypothetical protein